MLRTPISAPVARVFDLARDVDVHQGSMAANSERVVAGVMRGPMAMGDEVTWEARHFGVRLQLTSRITVFEPPHRFVDEQVRGPFAGLRHVHEFHPAESETLMVDVFDYAAPVGFIGRLADLLFLRRYMTRLLCGRNAYIKRVAEGGGHDKQGG